MRNPASYELREGMETHYLHSSNLLRVYSSFPFFDFLFLTAYFFIKNYNLDHKKIRINTPLGLKILFLDFNGKKTTFRNKLLLLLQREKAIGKISVVNCAKVVVSSLNRDGQKAAGEK